MKVINFFAGAGAGKSTMAAKMFVYLKENKVNTELITEYAKDLVWGESFKTLDDQLYLLAKQNRRLERVRNKVDVAVTDSPLALNLFYAKPEYLPIHFRNLIKEVVDSYENINLFIDRGDRFYNPKGRYQTEEKARQADIEIKKILENNNIKFSTITTFEEALNRINFNLDS